MPRPPWLVLPLVVVAASATFAIARARTAPVAAPSAAHARATTNGDGDGTRAPPTVARATTVEESAPAPSVRPERTLPWGADGPARTDGETPRGAGSFAIGADGETVVLDELGGRVLRVDAGGRARAVPLPFSRADDVVLGANGRLVVLDRAERGAIAVETESGWRTIPLAGAGLEDPRDVSRVVARDGRVYVQQGGNGPLLEVADAQGRPSAERPEVQGVPTRSGTHLVSAGVIDVEKGRVWVTMARRADATHVWTRELRYPVEVGAVGWLDTDDAGRVYVVALGETAEGVTSNWLTCLREEDGARISTQSFPVQPRWDAYRDFEVLPGGGLVVALREPAGVRFVTVRCD